MELRAETSVFDDKLLKEDIDNAQETADNAQVIAGTTAQYFWFLEEIGSVPAGVGTGAHITNLTKEEFLSNPANGGGNLLARSNGIAIRDGLTELAIFSANQLRIGRANAQRAMVNSGSLELYDAQGNKYFMVSADGLSYGSHVVATQEDITDIESTATSSTAVKTQYYLSTSASSATGGSWQDTVPTWSTGKYIWTRVATTKTTMGGTSSTSYSTAVYDRALTTALSTSESAQSSANSGASTVTTTQQFYLSTSSSSATGGSWSDSAPTWSTGHYVWTRYKIVKTTVGGTTSTSYTTGIYDKTLTDALSSAEEAKKTATNYMFVDSNGALNIASANPSTATRKVNISADGIKIQNDANNYAFVESGGTDIYQGGNSVASFGATARIGKEADSNIVVTSASITGNSGDGEYFDVSNNGGQLTTTTYQTTSAYGGTGAVTINLASSAFTSKWNTIANGGTFKVKIVYKYKVKIRTDKYTHQTKTIAISFTKGTASTSNTYATYNGTDSLTLTSSYPAVAGGTYLGRNSVALGKVETTATPLYRFGHEVAEDGGAYGFTVGHGTKTFDKYQLACGEYNTSYTNAYFIVGNGSSDSARSNAFVVDKYSDVLVGGTIVHTSDRRLKKHISYLDDDAVDFVDKLKPAYFTKNGKKQVGFYAQDVAEIDKWKCMIGDNLNGYMTLNYEEIIAPLVTYVQKLEKRIKELERRQ